MRPTSLSSVVVWKGQRAAEYLLVWVGQAVKPGSFDVEETENEVSDVGPGGGRRVPDQAVVLGEVSDDPRPVV
ncbi:hypothetical protein [Timonella senegalensis]|uniref:hypothetical protein n=1 Tax=Timonella senegalensis TaxID=1465825 RepID=UPI002FDD63DD